MKIKKLPYESRNKFIAKGFEKKKRSLFTRKPKIKFTNLFIIYLKTKLRIKLFNDVTLIKKYPFNFFLQLYIERVRKRNVMK